MNDPRRTQRSATVPRPPLTRDYADETRRSRVRRMVDRTASDYDGVERLIGFGSGARYRRDALVRAGLRPWMRVVDVGAGTGPVKQQAAATVGDPGLVNGIDSSPGMLDRAIVPAGVRLIDGSAERIPFPDANFDFASIGHALRHITATFRPRFPSACAC